MLTSKIRVEGPITCAVESVSLVPQFTNWRDEPGVPPLAYRVKVSLPLPAENGVSELARATIWIPTDIIEDTTTGEEKVATLGIESGTPMIPTADSMAAEAAEQDGKIKLENGCPVPSGPDKGRSHWTVARLVPVKGGATLSLTGITITPSYVSRGPLKGSIAVLASGEQVVGCRVDDWEPGQRIGRRAGGEARSSIAAKGAHVPDWVHEQREATANE